MTMRALVVDDSVVYRRSISQVLTSIGGVEVVATACSGSSALERLRQLRPDLVTLDMEMPGMDGLQTLDAIGHSDCKPVVIVVSGLSRAGGELALRALQKGAFDFVTKPDRPTVNENLSIMREELVPRIKALAHRMDVREILRGENGTSISSPGTRGECFMSRSIVPDRIRESVLAGNQMTSSKKPKLVLIGVSTGGPNALGRLFSGLPGDLGVPVLVVQHMPPLFTQLLAEDLSTKSRMPVREAIDGEEIVPNHAYLAPGGRHMRVVENPAGVARIQITNDSPENHCKPSVDYLFRSVAQNFPGRAMAVILTGMGDDGTSGLKLLKSHNCPTIVQDEQSCVVFGMPKAAIDAGLADSVLPLDAIAGRITSIVRGGICEHQHQRQ